MVHACNPSSRGLETGGCLATTAHTHTHSLVCLVHMCTHPPRERETERETQGETETERERIEEEWVDFHASI